jgi:hypothetical protein
MMQEDGEVEEGATPPRTSALGTANWGTATLVGVFAGLLYGGSKEASASVVSCYSTLSASCFLSLALYDKLREIKNNLNK